MKKEQRFCLQFGSYGTQKGDSAATITAEEQRKSRLKRLLSKYKSLKLLFLQIDY